MRVGMADRDRAPRVARIVGERTQSPLRKRSRHGESVRIAVVDEEIVRVVHAGHHPDERGAPGSAADGAAARLHGAPRPAAVP